MTDLTKGKAPWVWLERCQKAFEDTKQALTSSPVLVLPDYSRHFEVVCEASITGIGAVLIQEGRPVAFDSKKLSPAERNYTR